MNVIRLIGCIGVCEAAGMIGSIFTAQSVRTWYVELTKPSFSPPNWAFAPVWITLYAMMGIALYIEWEKSKRVGNLRLTSDILHLEIERMKVLDRQRSLPARFQWTCCNCSGF
jgi:tryptophan-rich sensory protein